MGGLTGLWLVSSFTANAKIRQKKISKFLNFALFLYFISNILPKTVDTCSIKKIFT